MVRKLGYEEFKNYKLKCALIILYLKVSYGSL